MFPRPLSARFDKIFVRFFFRFTFSQTAKSPMLMRTASPRREYFHIGGTIIDAGLKTNMVIRPTITIRIMNLALNVKFIYFCIFQIWSPMNAPIKASRITGAQRYGK